MDPTHTPKMHMLTHMHTLKHTCAHTHVDWSCCMADCGREHPTPPHVLTAGECLLFGFQPPFLLESGSSGFWNLAAPPLKGVEDTESMG